MTRLQKETKNSSRWERHEQTSPPLPFTEYGCVCFTHRSSWTCKTWTEFIAQQFKQVHLDKVSSVLSINKTAWLSLLKGFSIDTPPLVGFKVLQQFRHMKAISKTCVCGVFFLFFTAGLFVTMGLLNINNSFFFLFVCVSIMSGRTPEQKIWACRCKSMKDQIFNHQSSKRISYRMTIAIWDLYKGIIKNTKGNKRWMREPLPMFRNTFLPFELFLKKTRRIIENIKWLVWPCNCLLIFTVNIYSRPERKLLKNKLSKC